MNTARFLKDLKQREQATNRGDYQKSNIPFMKLTEGKHRLRFLPKGNKEENLPYKAVEVHTLMVSGGGGKFVQYILCYDWLFSHENAIDATIKPLMKMKSLTQSDVTAFKQAGGCPICRAYQVLRNGGEDKDVYNSCRSRLMSYWNVLNRTDKKIYVASLSDAKHREVCSAISSGLDIDEDTGKIGPDSEDILDLNTGFDFQCIASGQNMGRRYAYSVIAKKKPVTSEDIAEGEKPINLMLAVAETFKSYGEMCTMLRQVHGVLLESYGFKYGIALKEEEKKGVDLDLDDDEDEVPTKVLKANKSTNPSSVEWDEEDESSPPKIIKSKHSNDLKEEKINKLTGNKLQPAPWEEDESDDDDDDDDDDEPVKESTARTVNKGGRDTKNVKQKKAVIFDDEDDEEVEIDNGKLTVGGVELF